MLTNQESLLVAIILMLFGLIFATRLKTELIAILILLSLSFTGLVSTQRVLSGFSSSVVITLIGLFIITRALEETGVVHWIAARLNNIGGGSEVKLLSLFMFAGASISLIMNNVAAGAVLLPAAVRVARISDVRVSKLLMPMSFGTLVGGMATYLTTANIVMSELLVDRGIGGLGMLDFIPVGGMIVLATLIYMTLIGRHLLPERETLSKLIQPDLQRTYQLEGRIWKIRVGDSSNMVNKTIHDSGIGVALGLTVPTIWRGRHMVATPKSTFVIQAADILSVVGRKDRIEMLLAEGNELLDGPEGQVSENGHHVELPLEPVEIVIAPRSHAIGQTLTQLEFRSKYSFTVVALWREGRSYRTDVGKMALQVGDALLVVGNLENLPALIDDRNYIIPSGGYSSLPFRPQKAPFAIVITAIVLLIAIVDILPLPLMMLAGAAAMVITGCLTMEEFYDAVEWRVIFLVAGMLPLSIAIAETGLAARVGTIVVGMLSAYSPLILIAGMVILAMLVAQIIGGQVTALLVGPIAINAALQMNIDPRAMAVAVAMACSMAFLTPIAHPVNILMMGPGGYKFGDFFKVGFGMTIVTLCTMLLGMVVWWGIH